MIIVSTYLTNWASTTITYWQVVLENKSLIVVMT